MVPMRKGYQENGDCQHPYRAEGGQVPRRDWLTSALMGMLSMDWLVKATVPWLEEKARRVVDGCRFPSRTARPHGQGSPQPPDA